MVYRQPQFIFNDNKINVIGSLNQISVKFKFLNYTGYIRYLPNLPFTCF